MTDYQQRLLNEMLSKLLEARSYSNISMVLTILFLLEFVLVLLGYGEFDFYYFSILIVTFVGNTHMNRKHKTAIEEYEELKKEYEDLFETTDS
jgi:hypothetical protein